MFCIRSTDVFIEEVRCFYFPGRISHIHKQVPSSSWGTWMPSRWVGILESGATMQARVPLLMVIWFLSHHKDNKKGLNRNFLGAIVTHMWVLSPFSLIQNRTGDFGAPFAHLRGSALQPSTQVSASVLARTCVWDRLHLGISPMIFLLSRKWLILHRH